MRGLLRWGSAVIALVALSIAGCGDDGAPAPPVLFDDLVVCDITTEPCQRGIYASVAAMLDAEGFQMPRIRTISVEQHADEVRSGLDLNDLTGEDATSRGLRLMGFLPEQAESLTSTQVDYVIDRVAAYYTRNSRSITIIDRDYEQGDAQVLLAHELIHAIQDSQFNLGTVGGSRPTEDGIISVRSVIEGDAVYSSLAWYYETRGDTINALEWASALTRSKSRLRDLIDDPSIALIDIASSFPYSYGFAFMTEASLDAGLAARTAAFEAPPTTAEVLVGYGMPAPSLSFPDVAHPAPVDGDSPEVENRYGAWYVYSFLRRQGLGHDDAWATALTWVGDQLAIYEQGDDVVAVWRVRFDEADNAAVLSDQVNGAAGVETRTAVAFEDDAYVFAAATDETLVAWASQPLDGMTASIVPKDAARFGGGVSVGGCMLSHDVVRQSRLLQ